MRMLLKCKYMMETDRIKRSKENGHLKSMISALPYSHTCREL